MMVLYTRDLRRSIEFYRLLGLEVPDPSANRPVSVYRTDNGVTIIFTTDELALRFDPDWARPGRGYQQVMEFVVDGASEVDDLWIKLRAAGYHGRTAPAHINGPYATMVDDPDGNVVLITNDKTSARDGSPHRGSLR
jgi:predicted lactoylglutathione lyase